MFIMFFGQNKNFKYIFFLNFCFCFWVASRKCQSFLQNLEITLLSHFLQKANEITFHLNHSEVVLDADTRVVKSHSFQTEIFYYKLHLIFPLILFFSSEVPHSLLTNLLHLEYL
jgi:hypothetical protein